MKERLTTHGHSGMENLCNIFNIYMATTQAHKSSAGDVSRATRTRKGPNKQTNKKNNNKKFPVNNKFLHATAAATTTTIVGAAKSAEL